MFVSAKRSEIEQAATSAIKREGFKSVSFRTLAEQVAVKSSSVHYHFRTKDDLAEAVIRSYTEAFEAALHAIEQENETLLGKLDGFQDLFAEVVAQDDICLCGMMAAEVRSLGDGAKQALRAFFRISESWLEKTFAAHASELSGQLSAAELAGIFMAGLEGATLVDRVDGKVARLQAFRSLSRSLIT